MTTSSTGRMLVRHRLTRLERWAGPTFVLLALASSSAVSLPLSSDPPARVIALYDTHRLGYVLAQVVGLGGVVALLLFVRALHRTDETPSRAIMLAGLLTAASSVATNVAVLVLCFARLSLTGAHRAAVATDLTDDVLFLAFACFSATLALSGLPRGLRVLAAMASVLCLGRSLQPWVALPGLEVVAPLSVLLALLLVALRVARAGVRPGQETAAGRQLRPSLGR